MCCCHPQFGPTFYLEFYQARKETQNKDNVSEGFLEPEWAKKTLSQAHRSLLTAYGFNRFANKGLELKV